MTEYFNNFMQWIDTSGPLVRVLFVVGLFLLYPLIYQFIKKMVSRITGSVTGCPNVINPV